MSSWVQIANMALRRCGSQRIASIDEATSAARAVKDVYLDAADFVLSQHPWNCNTEDTHLAVDADAPDSGFAYQYTLPPDPYCLVVHKLDRDHHGDAPWKVKGRKIHTDEAAPLYIEYGRRITDPEELPPLLVTAIAEEIAARIAFRLTNSSAREDACEQRAGAALRKARSADAQEGTPDEEEEGDWEAARR